MDAGKSVSQSETERTYIIISRPMSIPQIGDKGHKSTNIYIYIFMFIAQSKEKEPQKTE